jgi:methionyl-tRNA synthetase
MWPAILMAASKHDGRYNIPTNVPANEFLMLSGAQFSKSRKNALYVHEYLEHFEPAPLRYYLTTNMPELKDTDFSLEDFVARNNDELLGTLGNFVNRVLTFTYKNFGGAVSAPEELTDEDEEFLAELGGARDLAEDRLLKFEFKASLRALMELARAGNVYFDRQKPWQLVREDLQRCGTVLNVCVQVLQGLAVLMTPYLPFKAQELWELLGMEGRAEDQAWSEVYMPAEAGRPLPKPHPLIKKLDLKDVADRLQLLTKEEQAAAEAEEREAAECLADELDMVVARIKSVEPHPDADKLIVATIDMGPMGERTLVAGLRGHFELEELQGATIVVVANLAPAKLRGIESQAMVLAAEDRDGTLALLRPAGEADPGDRLWSPIDPSEKDIVEFKRFQQMEFRVEAGDRVTAPHGLPLAELVVVTPDRGGRRVLHTPRTVITLDRPVSPGSKVY